MKRALEEKKEKKRKREIGEFLKNGWQHSTIVWRSVQFTARVGTQFTGQEFDSSRRRSIHCLILPTSLTPTLRWIQEALPPGSVKGSEPEKLS